MSLIQEALKRQQQENDDQPESTKEPKQPTPPEPVSQLAPSTPPIQPPTPPVAPKQMEQPNLAAPIDSTDKNKTVSSPKKPMSLVNHAPIAAPAHAVEPEKPGSKNKPNGNPWRKLIIALLILFLIIAAAGVMIFFALKKLAGDTLEQVINEYGEEVENIVYVEPEAVETVPEATKSESEATSLSQKITKKKAEPITQKTPTRVPVKWPELKVTAALAKGGVGQAIINGKFITVGDKIDGVTLMKISGNVVEFSYKNEIKFLKVGN